MVTYLTFRLKAMTELDREMVLAERRKKIDAYEERENLKKRLQQNRHRKPGKVAVDSDEETGGKLSKLEKV